MELKFSEELPVGEPQHIAVSGASIDMIWCPAGSFRMGTPKHQQEPDLMDAEHVVRLSHGFWIGRTLVTSALWRAVMKKPLPRTERDEELPFSTNWSYAIALTEALMLHLHESGILLPSHVVSLPTEAQWEYACRAGTDTRWYFGEDERLLVDHAWYAINSSNHMHPVARKQPNPWGIFDLYGNVPEWCLDDYGPLSESEEEDPYHIYGGELKVIRGGGYDDGASVCRSGSRRAADRNNDYNDDIGFRVVMVSLSARALPNK